MTQPSRPSFGPLPADVSLEVMSWLDTQSLGRVARVSKESNRLVEECLKQNPAYRIVEKIPEAKEIAASYPTSLEKIDLFKRTIAHLNEANKIYGTRQTHYKVAVWVGGDSNPKQPHVRNIVLNFATTCFTMALIGATLLVVSYKRIKQGSYSHFRSNFKRYALFNTLPITVRLAAVPIHKRADREVASVQLGLGVNHLFKLPDDRLKATGAAGMMDREQFDIAWTFKKLQAEWKAQTLALVDDEYVREDLEQAVQNPEHLYNHCYENACHRLHNKARQAAGLPPLTGAQFGLT